MFIDASALTAILAKEEDFREITARLEAAAVRSTSPLAVWETVVALARILAMPVGDAAAVVEAYLSLADIVVLTVVAATTPIALDAFDRYGKGRGSPAGLNFGDCFAYACARYFQQPLLCKGNDFAHTDIDLA